MTATEKNLSVIDLFGTRAATIAMRGAADFMAANGLKPDRDINLEALTLALRLKLHEVTHGALADARDAFEAGMPEVAEATFAASMRLAGIDAVKEVR